MPRIEYDRDIPDGILERIKPLVSEYVILLPSWVEEVRVSWNSQDETGSAMCVYSFKDYQWVKLVINQHALTSDKALLREYVRHEMCHPMLQQTKAVQADLLEALDLENSNPALFRWAQKQITEANEAATQAMCEAIRRIEDLYTEKEEETLDLPF